MTECRPHFRKRDGRSIKARASAIAYTPPQVAAGYGIPRGLDGSGTTIALIELGGAFSQADLSAYLVQLGLPDVQAVVINVAGGSQQPDPGGADVEVMLDACIAAAVAPGARLRLYFAPNTNDGFAAAIAQAALECDVISISWGAPETQWDAQSRAQMDAAFQAAIQRGVCCYAAAGDNGAADGTSALVADYPSSSPYCVGVGGTTLVLRGNSIAQETVWNDGSQGGATGGGFSRVYAKPSYQSQAVQGMRRGVPDCAAMADPETGWIIRANGQMQSVGGTSAAAPFWAAVNALLNQAAGKRLGFLPDLLYQHPEAFRDITGGDNAGFQAGPGWDACTGLGSPNGPALFALAQGGSVVTPPPPPPPPPGGPSSLEQLVQSAVDSLFDSLIAQEKGRFVIVRVLKMLKSQVDQEIQRIFASNSHVSGVLSQIIAALIDAGFKAVEAKYANLPWVVEGLEMLRPVVEKAALKLLQGSASSAARTAGDGSLLSLEEQVAGIDMRLELLTRQVSMIAEVVQKLTPGVVAA